MVNDKRDNKGRFAEGNGGGPGRKPKKIEGDFLDAIRRVSKPEDVDEVWLVLQKKAKSGNLEAIKLYLAYIYGTPVQKNEHTGKDGGVIRVTLKGLDD